MRHYSRQLLGSLVFLLLGTTAAAAQQVVQGRVVDAQSSQPLASVLVSVKGAKAGVLTNPTGSYRINAQPDDSLTFQIIGYGTETVAVNGRSTVNVGLSVKAIVLDEIVAVGYTNQTRRSIAGAVGSVQSSAIQTREVTQVQDVLNGRVAGVNVQNNGQPGQAAQITIRGAAFTAGNNPLYVVDGMYMSDLRNINPDDIQSIEVLKDASAASQYGARAASGVIVISTKKGAASDHNRFTLRSSYGTQTIPRLIPMMNSQQWATLYQEKYQNSAAIDPTTPAVPSGALDVLNGVNTYDTDWQKAITRTGHIQDHNLSISGGTQNGNATYFISGGYTQQTGTLLTTNFDRYTLRVNSQLRRGRLTIGENLSLARSNRDDPAGPGGALANAVNMFPSIPELNDGNFGPTAAVYGIGTSSYPSFANNPIGSLVLNRVTETQNQMVSSLFGHVDILPGLQYRLQLGLSYNDNGTKNFSKFQMVRLNTGPFPASLSRNSVSDTQILLEHLLSLNRTFGGIHAINGTVGFTQQDQKIDNLNASRTDFSDENLQVLNAGTQQINNGETRAESRLNSILARVGYTLMDRYIVEGNFRRDGSTRFGPLNRWGNFYSGALGWIVSDEPFFKSLPLIGKADYLKLRGSYGTQGNQDFADYEWMSLVTSDYRNFGGELCCAYIFGPQTGTVTPALGVISLSNPRLKWQSNKMTNIGIDLGLLDNRLSITAEYYKSKSSGVLARVPLIPSLGSISDPYVNAAALQNTGFEFTVQHTLSKGDLTLTTGLNLTTLHNKVLALGGTNQDIITGASRTSVGHPLGSFYVMQTCGIFQNQAQIDAHGVQPNARPGDLCFVDIDGDGIITQDGDRHFAGDPNPKVDGGLFFDGSYRSFDFTVGLRGAFGQKVWDGIMPGIVNTNGDSNAPAWLKTWQSENDGSNAPKAYWGGLGSDNARGPNDRFLEKGDYLRFQNVELGYRVPTDLLGRMGVAVDHARIYVNLQDIYTATSYLGYDPQFRGGTLTPGEDPGAYPSPRTITMGIDVGF